MRFILTGNPAIDLHQKYIEAGFYFHTLYSIPSAPRSVGPKLAVVFLRKSTKR
jgi:hypothetical protein